MVRKSRLPPLLPTNDLSEYPIFTGAISRWAWRIYAQRLTAAGRWFAFITAIFVFYGGVSHSLQIYVLAIYAGGLWLVAFGAMLVYRPRAKLTARFSTRVCAGESLRVDVEIQQLGRGHGADLVVVPHRLAASIEALPPEGLALPDLRQGEKMHAEIRLKCQARGSFTLRGFRLESGFPFGILRGSQMFAEERNLLVYPKFFPLGRLDLPTGRRYQPGGVALVSQLGESFEYLGNREYREGDNVRNMDWRATARAQRPIVREWVEEYMLRAAVILDTHVPALPRGRKAARSAEQAGRKDAFERAVSVAAAVSDYMARQDYLVDLFAAGPDLYHLTAGRSLAYLDQILDILACVNENSQEPFEIIEPQMAELLERLSTVICVFLDWDETRRGFAMRLRAQGVAVKAIICHHGKCTMDPSADVGLFGEIPVISQAEFDRGISQL